MRKSNKAKYGERIFVSGKVSGMEYSEACRQFYSAALVVLNAGMCPVVPVDLCRSWWGWYRCMAVCLWELARCRYILQLPNWLDSRGAKWEYRAARLMGKCFVRIEDRELIGV